MKKFEVAGVQINKVSFSDLIFNKMILISFVFLAIGLYGVYEVIIERYFFDAVNLLDASKNLGSPHLAESMREAIFGHAAEVKRENPWTIYIVNYMYLIYTGSGIIFIVALAEIFNIKIIQKTAAGFMTLGLCVVLGGLFTIAMDLNILNMHWMFLTPNITAGMWLMLPLYSIYIPFVAFEIYLLITKNKQWAKKIAFAILLLSIVIDIIEFYIQAKLFDMNTARHLWTTYPNLTLYFIISAFVASAGMMIMYSFIEYKDKLGDEFNILLDFLKQITLVLIIALAAYEAVAFLFIDKQWANVILFGNFKYDFYIYMFLAIVLPFSLLGAKLFNKNVPNLITIIASISLIAGTYIGRLLFVYGGNAYPMSNRFGTGFEKYNEYAIQKDFLFFAPTVNEICIVLGSIGVVIFVYEIINKFLEVTNIREH